MKHTALTVEEAATEIYEQDNEADEDADKREIFSRVDSCKNREVQERRENNSESRPSEKNELNQSLQVNLWLIFPSTSMMR